MRVYSVVCGAAMDFPSVAIIGGLDSSDWEFILGERVDVRLLAWITAGLSEWRID